MFLMKLDGYKSNNNVVYSNKFHIVWCPKYRRPVLQNDVAKRLEEIIHQTCDELKIENETSDALNKFLLFFDGRKCTFISDKTIF
jgi:hypothetical protein